MSNITISMNGEPLGAIQKWHEDYFTANGLLHVTIKIERIIFDEFSMLAHILNGGEVELSVQVGEQKTEYTALQLKAGSRNFNSEDGVDIETLVLSTAHRDKELEELKDYLGMIINAKNILKAETVQNVTM